MKNLFYTLSIFLFTFTSLNAQIFNQNGTVYLKNQKQLDGKIYFLDNLIKVKPNTGNSELIELQNIAHIELENNIKFIIQDITIDSNRFNSSRSCSDENVKSERLFMLSQVLVESDISLYKANFQDKTFYYIVYKGKTQPLYNSKCVNLKARNQEEYKRILYNLFKDKGFDSADFVQLKYTDEDLIQIITKINEENQIVTYNNKIIEKAIVINPFVGLKLNSYSTEEINKSDISSTNLNLNFGVDFSLALNKRNTFFMFLRTSFESLNIEAKGTKLTEFVVATHVHEKAEMNGFVVTPALGTRIIIIDKGNIRAYLDGAFEYNLPLNGTYRFYQNGSSSSEFSVSDIHLQFERDINATLSFSSALGVSFNKWTTEIRYQTNRDFGNDDSSGRGVTTGFIGGLSFNVLYRIM